MVQIFEFTYVASLPVPNLPKSIRKRFKYLNTPAGTYPVENYMINNVDISVKQKINVVRLQFELGKSIHGENVKDLEWFFSCITKI